MEVNPLQEQASNFPSGHQEIDDTSDFISSACSNLVVLEPGLF